MSADFSQAGEQGILCQIFDALKYDHHKLAVDIGAKDGSIFSNIKYIAEQRGWRRIQFDVLPLHQSIIQAKVTRNNVNSLLSQYGAEEIDLLSLDIDSMDYYVWKAIAVKPCVVVLEYNQNLDPTKCITVKYDEEYVHDGTDYYGASFGAMKKLSEEKGYTLVAVTRVNAIFIRNDLATTVEWTFNLQPVFERVWAPDKLNRIWEEV